MFWGRKEMREASRAVKQDAESREEEGERKRVTEGTDVQQLISLTGHSRRRTQCGSMFGLALSCDKDD